MDQRDDRSQKPNCRRSQEPPGSPERRQHDDGQGTAGLIPHTVFVAGRHLKTVVTRREFAVSRDTAVAGFGPGSLMVCHPVPEARPFGIGEIEAGIVNLQAFLVCRDRHGL